MITKVYDPASIIIVKNSCETGEFAAGRFIEVVKKYPDAIIILPTGATPIPMYKKIVAKFKSDKTIDLSKVKIFNLDEYVGITKDHPLSYFYYMKQNLYNKLDKIDKKRAPKGENRNIPIIEDGINPKDAAKIYENKFRNALKLSKRKKADLAILGIGSVGHIGFNEPGSKSSDSAKVVRLAKKTRDDTLFRFLELKGYNETHNTKYSAKVPTHAITLGIADILASREILLLANGENKADIIKEVHLQNPSSKVPATFLKHHKNVLWILDKKAAAKLEIIQTAKSAS